MDTAVAWSLLSRAWSLRACIAFDQNTGFFSCQLIFGGFCIKYLVFHIYATAYIISAVSPEILFKLLSDPTRLRMTALLAAEGELCVCEFTQALGESQPKVSRHLALMREEGLVAARRDGTWMHYRLEPGLPAWAVRIIEHAHAELCRLAPFRRDAGQLQRMGERPGTKSCA